MIDWSTLCSVNSFIYDFNEICLLIANKRTTQNYMYMYFQDKETLQTIIDICLAVQDHEVIIYIVLREQNFRWHYYCNKHVFNGSVNLSKKEHICNLVKRP